MINHEFLIVGQGLAGTMLAFDLFERGATFRILTSPQKSKASVVAAGMINPLVFKRLTLSWMADDLLPEMHRRYRDLEKLSGEKFLFEKPMLKPLSAQESALWREKMKRPEFARYIASVEEKSPVAVLSEAPAYGIVQGSGYLRLALLLERAAEFFREKGLLIKGEFDLGARVSGPIEFGDNRFEKLVFCEGYHLRSNPLFRPVKMNPAKGEVLQIHAPALSEDFILNKQVFVLPVGNRRFKVGSTYEWDDLSEVPTEKGRESIVARLANLIAADYTIENHLAGVRPTIADRRPVLGAHPKVRNVFVFNGLGTKGVMLVPYFSRVMAEFLGGNESAIPAEADVKRFFPW